LEASADAVSAVFIPPTPTPLVAPRNLAPSGATPLRPPSLSWKAHILDHPYFNSECECLVVFILNTRRRIKGHYLVSIGTMDTILCHPREIFRLAVMASASAIIICHNLCAATHKLCYVTRPVMWSAWDYVPKNGRFALHGPAGCFT